MKYYAIFFLSILARDLDRLHDDNEEDNIGYENNSKKAVFVSNIIDNVTATNQNVPAIKQIMEYNPSEREKRELQLSRNEDLCIQMPCKYSWFINFNDCNVT